MKSIIIKASAVTAILLASAGAYASSMDCWRRPGVLRQDAGLLLLNARP